MREEGGSRWDVVNNETGCVNKGSGDVASSLSSSSETFKLERDVVSVRF